MPYIRISATQKLTKEKQKELVDGLGEALGLIPGKDGRMLITDLEDGKTMFVGGVLQDDFVFVDARYYSRFTHQIKKAFTKAVFDAIHRVLGTPYASMSFNLTEYTSWGGCGDFKDEYFED
jgi:phenylpyruvate tautomerase PptA (4-oxalocrotonate tautomerase family)